MDDILHAPRDEDAQQAGLPLAKRLERYRAAWMDGMARVRLGARRFQHKLDEATAGGKRLFTPLNFLAVAAVVGYACIRLLKLIADKGKFGFFAYYCWAAGALTLLLQFLQK